MRLTYGPPVLAPSSGFPIPSQTRAIVLLAFAAFASQAMVRCADSLLPQIAADLGTTIGATSIVVSAYAFMHGSMQLIIGPIGDRVGKYRAIAIACAGATFIVLACGLAHSLTTLTLARLASGAMAAWIIPLGMAYIGDVVPYERRQQVLGRYLSGTISGLLFGQAAGGILGDLLGWRTMFFVLAGLFALSALALFRELAINPMTRPPRAEQARRQGFKAGYSIVLANPWARVLMLAVFLEAAFVFGAFTYVGADLHLRFGLSFTLVGLTVATFGIGGLIYAGFVEQLVARLGQTGLAANGGLILGVAYLMLALAPVWWIAPIATTLVGLGFYMLHNTLQTNATQMSPEARGTGVSLFSAALYIGQTVGVAVIAPIVDHTGAPAAFVAAAIMLPALGFWFAGRLRSRWRDQRGGE
jgi:predicted MFS family arabinose efflux permease